MEKIALFPGSFDPFTIGHDSVVQRSLQLFDRIIIAIGVNANKPGFFSPEERKQMIAALYLSQPRISVVIYKGLTVDVCKDTGAGFILRGLRNSSDFEYEQSIAQMNLMLPQSVETLFFMTLPEHMPVNSSIVRDILRHGGEVTQFLPVGMKLPDCK
jgi:pantetheine-phosphate adenylyltransferase